MIFSFIYFPVELFPVWIPHKFWQLQSYLKGQNDLNLLLHVSLQSVSSLHAWKTGFFVTMALFQVMVLEYIVMGLLAGFAFLRNFKIFFLKQQHHPESTGAAVCPLSSLSILMLAIFLDMLWSHCDFILPYLTVIVSFISLFVLFLCSLAPVASIWKNIY